MLSKITLACWLNISYCLDYSYKRLDSLGLLLRHQMYFHPKKQNSFTHSIENSLFRRIGYNLHKKLLGQKGLYYVLNVFNRQLELFTSWITVKFSDLRS